MEVDKIKAVLEFPLSLHMAYDKAKADGQLDVSDLGYLLDPLGKLPGSITGAKEALTQVKDLDAAERDDVLAWAKASYDIADDELEQKVEAGLELALSVAKFLGELQDEDPQPA